MTAPALVQDLALSVACPRCDAVVGEPCVDLRILASGSRIANQSPHPARINQAQPAAPERTASW